jgi:hypothetical protein
MGAKEANATGGRDLKKLKLLPVSPAYLGGLLVSSTSAFSRARLPRCQGDAENRSGKLSRNTVLYIM